MTTTHTTRRTAVEIAREHHVTPHRCKRCGVSESWHLTNDDQGRYDYALAQCENCGQINVMQRATILARIRRAAKRGW